MLEFSISVLKKILIIRHIFCRIVHLSKNRFLLRIYGNMIDFWNGMTFYWPKQFERFLDSTIREEKMRIMNYGKQTKNKVININHTSSRANHSIFISILSFNLQKIICNEIKTAKSSYLQWTRKMFIVTLCQICFQNFYHGTSSNRIFGCD